jgi:hypothetical protein
MSGEGFVVLQIAFLLFLLVALFRGKKGKSETLEFVLVVIVGERD